MDIDLFAKILVDVYCARLPLALEVDNRRPDFMDCLNEARALLAMIEHERDRRSVVKPKTRRKQQQVDMMKGEDDDTF